jgi:hypothetical protein
MIVLISTFSLFYAHPPCASSVLWLAPSHPAAGPSLPSKPKIVGVLRVVGIGVAADLDVWLDAGAVNLAAARRRTRGAAKTKAPINRTHSRRFARFQAPAVPAAPPFAPACGVRALQRRFGWVSHRLRARHSTSPGLAHGQRTLHRARPVGEAVGKNTETWTASPMGLVQPGIALMLLSAARQPAPIAPSGHCDGLLAGVSARLFSVRSNAL